MSLPRLFLPLLFVFSLSAQDSLPKAKLKLFDFNVATTLTGKESANLNMAYVQSFAGNSYYVSPDYTRGYSDTARFRFSYGPKRNPNAPKNDNLGSVYAMVGFNMSFQFSRLKNSFLSRVKPRIGIYNSSRRFFRYNIGVAQNFILDTLFFIDPAYPPIGRDSADYKNIQYEYKSKQVYLELGANVDYYTTRFFVLYTGILYSYGLSYKNEFVVTKSEYDGSYKYYARTEVREKEPSSCSHRVTVPLGVLFRFSNRKKFSPGIYAECSPGFESYKILGGRSYSHPICAFTWGFRSNFQKHR